MRTTSVSSTLAIALAGVLALSGCSKKADDDSVSKDPTSGAATEQCRGRPQHRRRATRLARAPRPALPAPMPQLSQVRQ
ncbi:hypothetical protein XPN_1346 [Xanthomonas arboricola pv. pruni MAFF 301427]|nr:hypothetical protein XPN_1346 [Xanthomonas arboricola pv. pruni MAFF 301427]